MKAYFDEFGHLLVDIEVKGSLDSKTVSAFIATCFDGYICLPTEIAVQLGLLLCACEPFELADGIEKKRLIFLGSAKFSDDDEEIPVEIVLTESMDTLVRIAMLSEIKMEVDFKKRGIKIEKSNDR
jgi:predicted aspartyl protease